MATPINISVGCIIMEVIGDGGHYRDGIILAAEKHGISETKAIQMFTEEMGCTPEQAQRSFGDSEDE